MGQKFLIISGFRVNGEQFVGQGQRQVVHRQGVKVEDALQKAHKEVNLEDVPLAGHPAGQGA